MEKFRQRKRAAERDSRDLFRRKFALSAVGRPLSFLDIKAGDFLRAWRGSIDSAEAVAPIAALIVSGHFCRIGKFGIGLGTYPDQDTQQRARIPGVGRAAAGSLAAPAKPQRKRSAVLDRRAAILRSAVAVSVLRLDRERRISAAHRTARARRSACRYRTQLLCFRRRYLRRKLSSRSKRIPIRRRRAGRPSR